MNKIAFPQKNYFNHLGTTVNRFNFDAMILIAISRYCHQLIIFEIFDMQFNFSQEYKYYFSNFEIDDLGKRNNNDIVKSNNIETPFDFTLSLFQKRYKGIIKINCIFVNKETLENSYYKINIELIPEQNMQITPFFLTDIAFKLHLTEFIQKIWTNILVKLSNIQIPNTIQTNRRYRLSEILVNTDINYLHFDDLTKDTYFIIFSILKNYKCNTIISTDDILNARALKKNKNASGVQSGFKKHEREKIHYALKILQKYNVITIIELSSYNYLINIAPKYRDSNYVAIPIKLCQYHYKNELWQKRIGIHLSLFKPSRIKVKILFQQVQGLCLSYKPLQIRDKFEETMDILTSDNIIDNWFYEKINETEMQGKNWFEKWTRLNIICRY